MQCVRGFGRVDPALALHACGGVFGEEFVGGVVVFAEIPLNDISNWLRYQNRRSHTRQ